jgi:hypothetical protein
MTEMLVENGHCELPKGVHPGVFVKSAQAIEKMRDELPCTAKECGKSANERGGRKRCWVNWYPTPRGVQMSIKRKELRARQFA